MKVYDLKLPTRIEAYEVATASIRRDDEVAFVCDMVMPPDIDGIGIRHYSFPDRWWSANVFVDMDGAPRTDLTHPFDCDITTPHFRAFDALCNIDLKLDVFARHDGLGYEVRDQDDFARCVENGLIDDHDRRAAEAGLAELVAMIEGGTFIDYLESICSRHALEDAAEVKVLPVLSDADVAVRHYWRSVRSTS